MKFYVASKTKHAKYWQQLRLQGVPIISTWIDAPDCNVPDETRSYNITTSNATELAARCLKEISQCDVLLLYIAEGDQPKGAFIEAGAALAFGKAVWIVAPTYRIGIFKYHPNVTEYTTIADALLLALGKDFTYAQFETKHQIQNCNAPQEGDVFE